MTADVLYLDDARTQSDPNGKLPPHDLEIERCVLSAAWHDENALPLIDWLLPEHFYSEAHKQCWRATIELRAKNITPDTATVAGWLRDYERFEQVGWDELLASTTAAPAVTNIAAYATRVYNLWRLRQSITICQRQAAEGYAHGARDVQNHLDTHVRAMARLAWRSARAQLQGNTDALREIVRNIQTAQAERLAGTRGKPGLPTGIPAYDKWTGGLHAAQKITIASVLGVGKTAYALQLSTHIARSGVGVLWILELSKKEMLQRQLAAEARVDFRHVINEELTRDEWDRVIDAMPKIENLPILFDDRSSDEAPSVAEIRALVQQAIERCRALFNVPLGVLVVDYVQRLKPRAGDEHKQERIQIGRNSRALEAIAKEFKIAVVELAQSRIEKDPKGRVQRPTVGSIADSREIEKSSWVLVFLHEEMPPKTALHMLDPKARSVVQLMPKNRNGPKNQVEWLEFYGAHQTFVDPSMHPQSRLFIDRGGSNGSNETGSTGAADPVDDALPP